MHPYILLGICVLIWGAAVGLSTFFMGSGEYAFVVGSLGGLMLAIATGGSYYVHLLLLVAR